MQKANGNSVFILDHKFTSLLHVGSTIKIVGFALGRDGITVTDTETIEVKHTAEYSLEYQKSYYTLAREGLVMDIKKKQEQCHDVEQTVTELTEDDLSRLSCKLLSIKREFMSELPKCQVAEN